MARKPDDWMPLHIGDYHADTTHLSRDQHGAYLLLLMAYWRRGGALPADDARLAAIAKASAGEWKKLRGVLGEFFEERDGHWHQKRADQELAKANALTEAKSAAGKKGAERKWQNHNRLEGGEMAEPSVRHGQSDAPITQNPNPVPEHRESSLSAPAGEMGRKIFSQNASGGRVGFGKSRSEHVTIKSQDDRISRFQKKLAAQLGAEGWMIIAAATDAQHKDHRAALEACKAAARAIGKGWPLAWPTDHGIYERIANGTAR